MSLTKRQNQVLRLIAKGMATKEIAASIRISPKTVQVHRTLLYAKLGCDNRVTAAVLAIKSGIIDIEDL